MHVRMQSTHECWNAYNLRLVVAQVVDSIRAGHQAMVFVHSRKDTGKTGRTLVLKYQNAGDGALFDCSDNPVHALLMRDVKKSRNKCAISQDFSSSCAAYTLHES